MAKAKKENQVEENEIVKTKKKSVKPKVDKKEEDSKVKEEKVILEEKKLDNEKEAKRKNFFGEVKAFFILALIIAVVSLGVWYWYTHIYKDDKVVDRATQKQINDYKYVSYRADSDNYLTVLGEKYVILYDSNGNLLKIMDLDLNLIYENEGTYTDCFVGTDGDLYLYYKEDSIDEFLTNTIAIYKYEDKETKELKYLAEDMVYYRPIYLKNNDEDGIIGYSGIYDGYDENGNKLYEETIYLLDGTEYKLNDLYLMSDATTFDEDITKPLYLYSDSYVVIKNKTNKYGVLNIKDNEIVINPNYDELYSTKNGNYIAIKNKKAGIIDLRLKKLVDFTYDFIDDYNDYFVVSKNKKLAIMDNSYNLITDFVFDYQDGKNLDFSYKKFDSYENSFTSYQVKDKILLVTNNREVSSNIDYDIHEAYIISEDGTYKTIVENEIYLDLENEIIWTYNSETREYTFYNLDFEEMYKLNFNDYDITDNIYFIVRYGTLVTYNIANPLYFSVETGESIDKPKNYSYKMDSVELKYTGKKGNVDLKIDNKKITDFKYNIVNESVSLYNMLGDNSFYYVDGTTYIMVRKGE